VNVTSEGKIKVLDFVSEMISAEQFTEVTER